jgi:uncharacterized metal-binding protein YceD (DUF177 family)
MNKPRLAEQPWKVPVAVTDVPETGKHIDLAADAATRSTIARLAAVAGVPRLEAQFDLMRHGSDGLHVVGRVTATVEQNCVVTLEPMQTEIDEAVDMVFTPTPPPPARAERVKTLPDQDPPEAIRDGSVDLGALATEFLLLGIDPYPRKPGAVFDAPPAGDAGPHPFAALAALKKGVGGKDA